MIVKTAFSEDDKLILTASQDKTVKIWDRITGKELMTLGGHTDHIVDAGFSRDGSRIVSCSIDNTARVFDLRTGKTLRQVKHAKALSSCQLSADGKWLLTASSDPVTCLWNVADGKKLFSFSQYKGDVKSARFSPDEKLILTYDYDEVHVLKLNGQQLFSYYPRLKSYDKGGYYGIGNAMFSPDGKQILVTCRDDYTIRLVDVSTGKETMNIAAFTGNIRTARYNRSGTAIVSTDGSLVSVWDARSGVRKFSIPQGGKYIVNDVAFTRDDQYLLISYGNKTVSLCEALSGKRLYNIAENGFFDAFSHQGGQVLMIRDNFTAAIWDLGKRRYSLTLQGVATSISSARFNSSGDLLLVGGQNGPTRIIDPLQFENRLTLYTPKSNNEAIFSPDGSQVLTYAYDSILRLWDSRSGKEIMRIPMDQKWLSDVSYHPNGKMILAFEPFIINSGNHTARVMESASGRRLFSIQDAYGPDLISSVRYSPDGKFIISCSGQSVKFWDPLTGNLIRTLKAGGTEARLGPDGKTLVIIKGNDQLELRDPVTGTLRSVLKGHQYHISDLAFSPDHKWLASGSYDSTIRIWDLTRGTLLRTLKGHQHWVNTVQFHPAKNLLLTSSWDNTVRIWNPQTGKLLTTYLLIDSTDLIGITPAGYYQSTPGAAKKLHYVTADLKIISFEQLDVRFNRPDKVLEAAGNTDLSLISSYRHAWEKRIKKLGIDTTAFRDGYSVPEADIRNREAIAYEQNQGTVDLRISSSDNNYPLDRFNIWINESPLFGQKGIRLLNRKNFDTTITVQLSVAKNRIETSVTNINGTESYRVPLYLNYSPAEKPKEMLRFIGIGIDRFADSSNNLQYSVKDIRDLARKLRDKYRDKIRIDTLFNQDVTPEKIRALKAGLLQTSVDDKVIVSYSGHGLLSKDYDYYLSTYAVQFDQPEKNGLPYEELENLLDSIPARRKLLLIDACHSGEVDKEEMIRITAAADSLRMQGTKGGKPSYTGKSTLGMKNSFELMQSLFVNVSRSTGATVISAAAGTQFALERGDLQNGVFTFSILEAMQQYPSMKISALKKIVSSRVYQLTNGLQQPTSRNEALEVDWEVW